MEKKNVAKKMKKPVYKNMEKMALCLSTYNAPIAIQLVQSCGQNAAAAVGSID